MKPLSLSLLKLVVMSLLLEASPVAAQSPVQGGRLIVTVNDTTGGFLPTATVTLAGAEASNRAAKIPPLQTTSTGIAIFDNLAPGRYTAVAEFSGFEKASPREVRVLCDRAGRDRPANRSVRRKRRSRTHACVPCGTLLVAA